MDSDASSCECTIKCKLFGAEVPPPMKQYFTLEQYQNLIGPLREYISTINYDPLWAAGCALGGVTSTPVATIIGIAKLGLIAPISHLILGLGAAADSGTIRSKIRELVEEINKQTRPLGFHMKDPLITNDIGITQSPEDIVDIEWVFY